ncbi:PepSY domain-containing protein [Novosphingobium sp. 9]|uniref:PepSY domain-containing protein n=1 Tax=Novosphingobium sp. 9 TaxID=2025349 RepID=UPI00391F9C98
MLYLGATGTWIQAIDLTTILRGARESNPVMQSINEGKFGDNDFSAVLQRDWTAPALPDGYSPGADFSRAYDQFRKTHPRRAVAYVEARMAHRRPVVQIGFLDASAPRTSGEYGQRIGIAAYDAASGHPVQALSPRIATPAPSTRQTLKEWHRFWTSDDVPGVYVEFVSGLAMCAFIGTGLVVYFRLLAQRRKLGRPQIFWTTSDRLRSLHRSISVAAAAILVPVALSGAWLGFESTWHTFFTPASAAPGAITSGTDARRIAEDALTRFHRAEPDTAILSVRVRIYAGHEQGIIVTAGPVLRQHVFDTASGREVGLTETYYPDSGFPLGIGVHEWMKHFHSGYLFGLPARLLDMLAGLALVFLSVSGLLMYIDLYRRRRKSGRKSVLWK